MTAEIIKMVCTCGHTKASHPQGACVAHYCPCLNYEQATRGGAQVLQSTTNDEAQQYLELTLALHDIAARARDDIKTFFEFVMVEENTKVALKLTPHQRVFYEFVQAHDRSVCMLPIGTSKSFCTLALILWVLGKDPTARIAVVSATQSQAEKTVSAVRDYIENARLGPLGMVFPGLLPSQRQGDPWTQTSLTIERPPGIRFPSLTAHGLESGTIIGMRLSLIIIDDLLNGENTNTKEQRDKAYEWIAKGVLSRLDVVGARCIVINTAWHEEDLVHRLSRRPPGGPGWPLLRMEITGDVEVQDDHFDVVVKRTKRPWDSDELRPKDAKHITTGSSGGELCRLASHDPDPTNSIPLWPEKFDDDHIERKRFEHLPHVFAQLYLNVCRDDATSMCKREYVELCYKLARQAGVHGFIDEYRGNNVTFTGVDLAFSVGEEADDTALVTIECLPDGTRVILDIDCGRWPAAEVIERIFEKQRVFKSILRVENNAAQDTIIQWALRIDKALPIYPHTTGRAKAHPEHGLPGIFNEMRHGAWLFPNDKWGQPPPMMDRLAKACLNYTPQKHTADELMAMWFASVQAREFGFSGPDHDRSRTGGSGVSGGVMMR